MVDSLGVDFILTGLDETEGQLSLFTHKIKGVKKRLFN